ncbi:hypothetical protein GCM10009563_30970 [Subtercola frigoramans]
MASLNSPLADHNAPPSSQTSSPEARLDAQMQLDREAHVARRAWSMVEADTKPTTSLELCPSLTSTASWPERGLCTDPSSRGRALLYVWDDSALPVVLATLAHLSWRV